MIFHSYVQFPDGIRLTDASQKDEMLRDVLWGNLREKSQTRRLRRRSYFWSGCKGTSFRIGSECQKCHIYERSIMMSRNDFACWARCCKLADHCRSQKTADNALLSRLLYTEYFQSQSWDMWVQGDWLKQPCFVDSCGLRHCTVQWFL